MVVGVKLLLPIISTWHASPTASDNQVQLLASSSGLVSMSGGAVILITGEGAKGGTLAPENQMLQADEARHPWKVAHLGEGKP